MWSFREARILVSRNCNSSENTKFMYISVRYFQNNVKVAQGRAATIDSIKEGGSVAIAELEAKVKAVMASKQTLLDIRFCQFFVSCFFSLHLI